MSQCCSNTGTDTAMPGRCRCPVNGLEYGAVRLKTMLHHIRQPWNAPLKEQGYYFCSDPECEVVYFGQDGSIFPRAALRTRVGIKEQGRDDLICYCFGVTKREAEQNHALRQYVADKTRESMCSCESRNPAGRCCLGDFPKP